MNNGSNTSFCFPPPLDEESQDFLQWAVKDHIAVRFFARNAKNPEWLLWANERKNLDHLFEQSDLSPVDSDLAVWIAENFVVQHANIVFAILESHKNVLNPAFGFVIIHQLAHREPIPDGNIISKWSQILFQNQPLPIGIGISRLIERCIKQNALISAVQLFEYVTRPQLHLKEGFSWGGDASDENPKTDVELKFSADHYHLNEIWEKYLKPKLPELALNLWPGIFQNLNLAYQIYKGWGKADSAWDLISWHRSAIEPHEQDEYPHNEDVLISAARDCLEWALKNIPQIGLAWIESLSVMEPLILRRLAVYGVSLSDLTANEKINWVLSKDFVLTFGLKHEVFQLFRNAYRDAEPGVRRSLLEAIAVKSEPLPDDDEKAMVINEYEKFNLLYWLSQSSPGCQEVAARLVSMKEKYSDFVPREHPDMDHWMSEASWVGPRSPVSVEDLLKKRPAEWFEFFLTFKGEDPRSSDRNGLLHNISEAVQQNFDWSKELVELLLHRDEPSSDLWGSVIQGWNGIKLSVEQWEYVLSILDNEKLVKDYFYYISDLLRHGIEKEEGGVPIAFINNADCVAQKVWATLQGKINGETKDWLTKAINHPGGKLAFFWLHALSRSRKKEDQKEEGLVQPYRMRFETIVSEDSEAATLGRVILASQLAFLFTVDEKWAKEKIVPLLDWDHDIQIAQQVWDGWLSWGQPTDPLLAELFPLFKKSFSHISLELRNVRPRFIEWVVGISLFWMDDPLSNGWMFDFLRSTEEQDRINFASQVGNRLIGLKEEAKIGLWNRWLKNYWEGRYQGIPVPLVDGELKAMVEWVSDLEPVFPEAVGIICSGRVPQFEDFTFFWRLREDRANIITRYPDDLAKLLVFLTTGGQVPRYLCNELENITEKLIAAEASAAILRQMCNNLAAIGCVKASELNSMIK